MALTFNGTSGDVTFYVDGVNVDSVSVVTASLSGTDFVLGQDQDALDGPFDAAETFSGVFHDVRLFNDLRTADEIAASYRGDLPYDEPGLVVNWKFDQLSSDGVVVDTVSGNNLTVKHVSESGFTESEASLTFTLDENAIDGTVVGQVAGVDPERAALIASLLAADPDLRYSAETDKFYKANLSTVTSSTAQTNSGNDRPQRGGWTACNYPKRR